MANSALSGSGGKEKIVPTYNSRCPTTHLTPVYVRSRQPTLPYDQAVAQLIRSAVGEECLADAPSNGRHLHKKARAGLLRRCPDSLALTGGGFMPQQRSAGRSLGGPNPRRRAIKNPHPRTTGQY